MDAARVFIFSIRGLSARAFHCARVVCSRPRLYHLAIHFFMARAACSYDTPTHGIRKNKIRASHLVAPYGITKFVG